MIIRVVSPEMASSLEVRGVEAVGGPKRHSLISPTCED